MYYLQLEEQKKIIDIPTNFDELIQQLELNLINKEKKYSNKDTMQELLTGQNKIGSGFTDELDNKKTWRIIGLTKKPEYGVLTHQL